MIKVAGAGRRRPGMTESEFLWYHEYVHGKISKGSPATLRRYVQSHPFDSAFGAASDHVYQVPFFHIDDVTEIYFDDFDGMGKCFSDPYVTGTVGPDGQYFGDPSVNMSLVAEEREYAVPNPGDGAVKVVHFLRKQDSLSLTDFFQQWQEAHEQIMHTVGVARPLRRYVQSLQVPEGNRILAYFGDNIVIYEGYASLWYDESEALTSFRVYQSALEATLADKPFFLPSQSFFLMTREVTILDNCVENAKGES